MSVPSLSEKQFVVLETLCLEDRALTGLDLVRGSKGLIKPGTVYVTLRRMTEKGLIGCDRTTLEKGETRRYEPTTLGRNTFGRVRLRRHDIDVAEAGRFAMKHDDGAGTSDYDEADLIVVGVSRVGKTPLCLYLALTYSIRVANYPLIGQEFTRLPDEMPLSLESYCHKLIGLIQDPYVLRAIREARYGDSDYAKLPYCRNEIEVSTSFFELSNIPYFRSNAQAIEELASKIVKGLQGGTLFQKPEGEIRKQA